MGNVIDSNKSRILIGVVVLALCGAAFSGIRYLGPTTPSASGVPAGAKDLGAYKQRVVIPAGAPISSPSSVPQASP